MCQQDRAGVKEYLMELYSSKNILKALVVKYFVGRYKNSLIGAGWHFIVPLISLAVYYVVFSQIRTGNMESFWVYVAVGIFPFHYMVNNLTGGSGAIVGNSSMVKKMYFPREILVFAQSISTFIVMFIGLMVILLVTLFSRSVVSWSIVLLPLILLILFIFVTGMVFLLSSITVYIRDVQYFLSSVSMVFFFITPMYFETESLHGILNLIVWLNPFTYFVELFHVVLYDGVFPQLSLLVSACIISAIVLLVGVYVFNKLKSGFVERL